MFENDLEEIRENLFTDGCIGFRVGNEKGKEVFESNYDYVKKCINRKGRSAFRIAFISYKREKYGDSLFMDLYLTIDDAGQFDHSIKDADFFLSDANNIKRIRVNTLDEKTIMEIIERVLNMTNEEVMKEFNIKDMGDDFLPIALLVDDIVQKNLEVKEGYSSGDCIHYSEISDVENGYFYKSDLIVRKHKDALVRHENNGGFCCITIANKRNGNFVKTDWIRYTIEEGTINLADNVITSKLGTEILQMLQKRFEKKKDEAIKHNRVHNDAHKALLQACKEGNTHQNTWDNVEKMIADACTTQQKTYEELNH